MKKSTKIMLIVFSCLFAVGFVTASIAAALTGFNYKFFNTTDFKKVSYTPEGEFNSIYISAADGNVEFYRSDDGKCRIECMENEDIKHSAEISGGALNIKRESNGVFGINFGGVRDAYDIKIYLPENSYRSLSAESDSGDVLVPEGFDFSQVRIYTKSGDASVKSSCGELLLVQTVSGDIDVENVGSPSVSLSTTSGDISTENFTADNLSFNSVSGEIDLDNTTAKKGLFAESVSGDIELDGVDSPDIQIKTTSGDVSGSLKSNKVFTAQSTSGSINIPKSDGSEKCFVKTVSGDIKIEID